MYNTVMRFGTDINNILVPNPIEQIVNIRLWSQDIRYKKFPPKKNIKSYLFLILTG